MCAFLCQMKRKAGTHIRKQSQPTASYEFAKAASAHSFEGVLMQYASNEDGVKMVNIAIVGDIGGWYGYNKEMLKDALSENVGASEISLYISSGGGDLEDALVMYDMIKGHPANVTAYLVGVVASAATVIACAADRIVVSQQCLYMIHNASMGAWGNYQELLHSAEILKMYENRALNIYQKRTNLGLGTLQAMLDQETWIESNIAVELGFADEEVDVIPFMFEAPKDYSSSNDRWDDDYYYMEQDNTGAIMYLNEAEKLLEKGIEPYQIKKTSTFQDQTIQNKISNMGTVFFAQLAKLLGKGGVVEESQIEETAAKLEDMEGLAELLTDEAIANAVDNGMKGKLEVIENSIKEIKQERASNKSAAKAPKMETSDLLDLLKDATDEDKAAFREALGISEADDTQETLEALEDSLAEIEQRHNEEKEVLNQKIASLGGSIMQSKKGSRKLKGKDGSMGLGDEDVKSTKANGAQKDLVDLMRSRTKKVENRTSSQRLKDKMAAMRNGTAKK